MLAGYKILQELIQGEGYVLSRGRRHGDGALVLLKMLRRDASYSIDATMLEREQEILQLEIPGVPRLQEILRQNGDYCLVLEDKGRMPLETLRCAQKFELTTFFSLAIKLVTVLSALHQRNVTYRNLNPSSILVHPTTNEVCLWDFTWATRSVGDAVPGISPLSFTRRLPYLSPEQTGRMNRTVDYRTDLYSLGVLFYELLTGVRPFDSPDPLEVVYWHLAKEPTPPHESDPTIPPLLSQLVMKLLAKDVDERYQSAHGLKHDLELCAHEWATHRRIVEFPLGQRDVWDRFLIPQKLYGRERERGILREVFAQSMKGQPVLLLVTGGAGSGKTSLVRELSPSLTREQGYFLPGKCEQFTSKPYEVLLQIFTAMIRQVLLESKEQQQYWRTLFSQVGSATLGIMTELIPELELIVDKQPPPPVLRGVEAQQRFRFALQNFTQVLMRSDHLGVMLLDDLHWADAATLNLLPSLLTQEAGSALLIGVYRDTEVEAPHPLPQLIHDLEVAGTSIVRVTLGPLTLTDLTEMVYDTLHCERAAAESLARLIERKTGGNPFFARQFLTTLHQDGFLTFDYAAGQWTFELNAIASAPLTDNVADLLARQLQELSPAATRALTLAACLGNHFDLATLATVSEQTPEQIRTVLREGLEQGMILATPEGNYAFAHDRIRQAASAVIPAERKADTHLTIGRLLRDRGVSDDTLFAVVDHLNAGRELITDAAERTGLMSLNLQLARKTKASAAYEATLHYLTIAAELLPEEVWDTDFDLAFTLHIETAECKYLCGRFAEAEHLFAFLLQRARTSLERATVYNLRVILYENQARYIDALRVGREGLAQLSRILPDGPEQTQAALTAEVETIQKLLDGRNLPAALDLPTMEDPHVRVAMRLLTTLWTCAYVGGDHVLAYVISAIMVRLSLKYGSSEESVYGYMAYAVALGSGLGDYRSGYELGELALRLCAQGESPQLKAKIRQGFDSLVSLWRVPLKTRLPHLRETWRSSLEAGDFLYAGYGIFNESYHAFFVSQSLDHFEQEYTPLLTVLQQIKMFVFADTHQLFSRWRQILQDETASNRSLVEDCFDENAYLKIHGPGAAFFLRFLYLLQLHQTVLFEKYDQGYETVRKARQFRELMKGSLWVVLLDFLSSLTLTGLYPQSTENERQEMLADLERVRASLGTLAENCAENFRCWQLLVSAEHERVCGREFHALPLYEEAIRYAQETQSIQNEALASELYARFWRQRKNETIARLYAQEAARCYTAWGATAKVRDLQEKYSFVMSTSRTQTEAAVNRQVEAADLDIATVIKAANAVTSEIELTGLLKRLLSLAYENAGAQHGFVLQEKNSQLFIVAEGAADRADATILQSVPLAQSAQLSRAIAHYVHQMGETIVIDDARTDDRFAHDPYIATAKPRSILCAPIVHQGQQRGLFYAENNLVAGAFTPARIKVMQILSTQVAIALENARLYDEVKQEAARRQTLLEVNNAIITNLQREHLFQAVFTALQRVVPFDRVAITTYEQEQGIYRILAVSGDHPTAHFTVGQIIDPRHYSTDEFDFAHLLLLSDLSTARKSVFEELLFADGIRSFCAVPLLAQGNRLGSLGVASCTPNQYTPADANSLREVGNQIALAMANMRAYEEIAALKAQLQAENVYLQEEIRQEHNFSNIVGNSPALLKALYAVEQVAPTNAAVLILGETGVGKELIARAIHDRSSRRDRPLVKINCAAISAGLVESELFGHVKGAFTGALESRDGRFKLADKGTLFLDEVGELPLETQAKLLRVLQEQEFEPVGGNKTIRVDVRVVAATNRNLEEAVQAGRFRADLFYRLNVFPLVVPALRERPTDIPQLVMFFVSRFARQLGKHIETVAKETMDALLQYSWPGNIRELQNVIERAVVLARGSVLTVDHNFSLETASASPPTLQESSVQPLTNNGSGPALSTTPAPEEPLSLEEIERRHILTILKQTKGVVEGPRGAAQILNLHPNTLRSRMKKLGIKRGGYDIS